MSTTTRFLVSMFVGGMLVLLLTACGGGGEPLPYSQAGTADTGVPTTPTPRVECVVRPELCT